MKQKSSFLAVAAACFLGIILSQASQPPPTGPATEKRFPPLQVPPGFKATLFACDPLIEYPSVIAAGPRPGALFVALDYMTGLGSDGKVKSEVKLVEDTDGDGYADKATRFAKGFNSIQGLAYHDGTVYVMHAPFLTALKFPSNALPQGDGRKDLLTGLGLTPEQNSSRLHCANGVVVGHDGWLYLALGDNGVNVPRPEGDRLVFNGGGILRCRPDGRDLHVFSTGLRNIYDIALDAELNVFTRDNENDGGTYMIRVCHCFHGSDHGYPYDYEERPDHAMQPIGDFGLGSSAGGVCYLETQFPPPYRGNLFFGEWGKSVVRYELKRSLSGFAPVKEIEFAAGDPKDTYPFKPTDVVVQRDGTMMISDYADGQRPKRGRGRIYHVAYVGKDAGSANKAKLDSESHYERWDAQSAIERTGKMPSLINLSPRGRLHAIWARVRIDGPNAIEELLRIAKGDPDVSVRAQAVRAVADLADPVLVKRKLDVGRGDVQVAERLAALGKNADPRVQLEITIALGRLRWAGTPDWLRDNLVHGGNALDHAAMQSLRRADNWPAVLKLLDQPVDSLIRKIALRALADRFETSVVDNLIARLTLDEERSKHSDYADLLTRVYQRPGVWKYWGYRPGPRPAHTEKWGRTDAIENALDRWLGQGNHPDRVVILKRMQREKIPVRLATLARWLKDEYLPDAAAAILASLKDYPAIESRPLFNTVVLDPRHSETNRMTSVAMLLQANDADAPTILARLATTLEEGPVLAEVLLRLGDFPNFDKSAALAVAKLKSPDAQVRAASIKALGNLRANEGRGPVVALLQDKDVRVRRAAAGAAGKLGAKDAVEPLLKLAATADPELRLACLDSLLLFREPRAVPFALTALNERGSELKALETLCELGNPEHARAVSELAGRNPSFDILIGAVRALTVWRDRPGTVEAQRLELDRAVAEIQGEAGMVLRWNVSPALASGNLPRMVEQYTSLGSPPDWKAVFTLGTEARLVVDAKDAASNSRWLAQADVAAPGSTPVEFLASSRGMLQVWLNGKSLFQRDMPRSYQVDSDRFTGELVKGTNRLLVHTSSSSGAVEFHLRFRRKSAKAEHEKLTQAALNRTGSPERGRKIFFDKEKSQCLKCHQISTQGERIGPEMTGVGNRFSRIHLIESILEPSRTIAPSFGTLVVTLKNGKVLNGVKLTETETTLDLADNQGQKLKLAKADIDERSVSAVSTMPDGLERRLTEDEFVDLIAFLANQKDGR